LVVISAALLAGGVALVEAGALGLAAVLDDEALVVEAVVSLELLTLLPQPASMAMMIGRAMVLIRVTSLRRPRAICCGVTAGS
jgi:hypothetical protein